MPPTTLPGTGLPGAALPGAGLTAAGALPGAGAVPGLAGLAGLPGTGLIGNPLLMPQQSQVGRRGRLGLLSARCALRRRAALA